MAPKDSGATAGRPTSGAPKRTNIRKTVTQDDEGARPGTSAAASSKPAPKRSNSEAVRLRRENSATSLAASARHYTVQSACQTNAPVEGQQSNKSGRAPEAASASAAAVATCSGVATAPGGPVTSGPLARAPQQTKSRRESSGAAASAVSASSSSHWLLDDMDQLSDHTSTSTSAAAGHATAPASGPGGACSRAEPELPSCARHTAPNPVGLTKNLAFAVLAAAFGSSFQHGYNGGVVNAPERLIGDFINQTYKQRTGNATSDTQIDFVYAQIVSIFCVGGCVGALLTALVADRVGRKDGLLWNNLLVFVASPLMASARSMASYELLIVGRLIIGINAGLNAGLAPLYLNEIAPCHLSGALGTIYQLVITVSILLSNIFGLPNLLGDQDSWPILFALPIIPAAIMLATLPHCCESPKYLLLNQGKELQAQQALAWLRQTGDVHEEMDSLRHERELQQNSRQLVIGDLFYDTSLRKPLTIAIVVMLSQQFSGINAILFFSTSIFRDAGLDEHAAVRATLGIGVVNVLMTLVSLFLMDKAGRRTLHMTGLMGMAATCLVLAICLELSANGSQLASIVAVVAVFVFVSMFASGPGAIPWFLLTELFPTNARPLASSIAVAVNWLANFTVSLCFLPLTNLLHGYVFVVLALLLVLFYLFTYYRVPETRGATAEEISALFKG